jgi:hypothetical protein
MRAIISVKRIASAGCLIVVLRRRRDVAMVSAHPADDITALLETMLRRVPATDLRTLHALDPVEMIAGYEDGRADFPCGDNRSRAYWHGWRNGMVDAGHLPADWASIALAKAYAAAGRRKHGSAA